MSDFNADGVADAATCNRNGDGIPDLAVLVGLGQRTQSGSISSLIFPEGGSISIHLGNSTNGSINGTFQDPIYYSHGVAAE